MKTHATIGARLFDIDNSDLMFIAHDLACFHHEMCDCSDYSNGLYDEQIPIAGRIVAI